MDQTFKVFDMMLKHRYKGQLDVDPEYAENACVVDYKKMLQAKVQAAQKNVDDHFQGWEATQMAKLIEEKLKAIAEAEKKEEEEQALKFRELRGENVSVLPEPINDDETIAKQKKAAEEAEAIQIATKAIEAKLEADKRQIYETKLNDLEYIADNYRAQLDDPQLKANKENFNDFILSEGVNEDYSDLIENMFAAYSEDEKKNNRHRYPKKVRNFGLSLGDFAKEHTRYNKGPHVHLKTFLFNYKRYLKDKFKKKDLVSTKKAKDLNSLLREYINEWKADFPKFYLHKMAKNSEDDKVKALKDFLPLEIVLRLNRKDLETFNYHKLNEQYINVENKLKEFNNSPFNTVRLQDKYQNTCGRLTHDLLRKKLVLNLLLNNMPKISNIQMETLIRAVDLKAKQKSDLLEKLGELLTRYKNHKVSFKEETFTLYDMADFIHTEIIDRKENELLFLLVAKFKIAINRQHFRPDEAEIDPRKKFDVTELDNVFTDLCDNNQKEIQIVSGFLGELEAYEAMNHYDASNVQVHEAIKDNLTASFILNYLDQLDKEIEEPCLKVMRLQGRTLRYWLDGTSRMSPECFKDMSEILKVSLSVEEQELMSSMNILDNYGGTQFFQSAIKGMDPSLAYTPDGQYTYQAGLEGDPNQGAGLGQDIRQLSFAELHPELGLSAAQYEELTKKSMLKGSVGVYIKDPAHHSFNLENKIVPKMDGMGAVYPTIFPTEYYKNIMDKERVKNEKDKWYLRPHHIETLTEHPNSLKDNLLDSNYYSFYTELEKDINGRYLTEEEVRQKRAPTDKDIAISSLESQLHDLKSKLAVMQPGSSSRMPGTVPAHEMQKYYMMSDREDKGQSVTVAFEAIMDDLRNKEKDILNKKRDTESLKYGMPDKDWYTDKSHRFTAEMKKYDRMSKADPKREQNMRRLMNRELY